MSAARKTLLVSFHGGEAATAINTLRGFPDGAPRFDLLVGAPPMKELRKFLFDSSIGHLYVANADKNSSKILLFTPTPASQQWQFQRVFVSEGLAHPFDVVFGPEGDLFVSNQDTEPNIVTRYDTTGKQVKQVPFRFKAVRGLAYDGTYLYVADSGAKPGYVAALDAKWTMYPIPVEQPVHLLWDALHRWLFIGSESENSVLAWNPADRASSPIAVIPKELSPINHTGGIALDPAPSGPSATLYVASRIGQQILSFPLDFSSGKPQWNPRTWEPVLNKEQLTEEPEFVGIAGGAYG